MTKKALPHKTVAVVWLDSRWFEDCGIMAGLTGDAVLEIADKINDLQNNNNNNNSKNNKKEVIDKTAGLVVRREENSNNQGGEIDMAPPAGNSIHRSGSRPQLDLSKAAILGNSEERDPTILLPNQSDDISHLSLDIGGIIICNSTFLAFLQVLYELFFQVSFGMFLHFELLFCLNWLLLSPFWDVFSFNLWRNARFHVINGIY